MSSLQNLDFLSVGIAIASILVLGFTVFFNNRRSYTNRAFLIFSIMAVAWGASNYLNSRFESPGIVLWVLRLHLFISIWYVFSLFSLMYIFPREKKQFSKQYIFLLLPVTVIISVFTLTPLVFSGIAELAPVGQVSRAEHEPGLALFVGMTAGLVLGAIFLLVKNLKKSTNVEKKQFKFVLLGISATFILHLIFNLVLPATFSNTRFIPLGAVFAFPLVLFTSYAIIRHHLLNIKIITTEIVTFLLAIVTLFEVVLSKDPLTLVFRSGVFSLVLAFGILLIKSVLKEVEQREELQKLSEQLKKANTELESLSRFKTQILSFASHQIKAPLAVIKQFATILMEGLYGPVSDKVKETLGKMKNSADELIDLINTLLDLRKVEEGKMDYKFETVKLKDLVQKVFDGLKIQADAKKLEFNFTSGTEASVSADPQKLKQVFQNLAENAIKYTPQGFVKLETKEEGGYAIFSVADSGLGIGQNLLPHLFDQEFVRDERVKREIKGTGLGLYIAKSIITGHGGTIWAESPGEGKGSTFYVKLRKV